MKFPKTPRLTFAFYMHSVPFTRDVLEHKTSLGGSESACRVLAEALAARGHDVHVFATQLEAPGDYRGVSWHADSDLSEVLKFAPPDVFVSLRMPHVFQRPIPAKLRIFWTQDLLIDASQVGQLFSVDKTVFVSQYHREQWCNLQPLLRPTAWVTRNPIAEADVDAIPAVAKIPKRLIHINRPERGLDGVIALWPAIRKAHPDATLAVCRYSSMYDKAGWGAVCADYDRKLEKLNTEVGGITFLGELDKTQLYVEIAKSVAMLYPTTQENFAETNCVAATEAQACGTPIIATRRGALPETIGAGAGILIDGEVLTDVDVQRQFLDAVTELFDAQINADETFDRYARMQMHGRFHAARAFGDQVARDWERMVIDTFEARYNANRLAVLRQLLHWDNHAAARIVAEEIIAVYTWAAALGTTDETWVAPGVCPELDEARDALALCDRVIRQEEQTAEHYAQYAIQDPAREAAENGRMHVAADRIAANLAALREQGRLRDRDGNERPARILDVSCGNGSMALVLAERVPDDTIIHGVDYSAGVIELARKATGHLGRRVRFWQITDSNTDLPAVMTSKGEGEPYDAVFCGEFVEHVEKPWELLDALESVLQPEGSVVLTTPCGPFAELLARNIPRQRGHIHAFTVRDLTTMCADKRAFGWQYLDVGHTFRGNACGYWLFGFKPGGGAAQPIDYTTGILVERPYQRLNAAMIVKDGAPWLRKCLDSLYGVVDAVRIIDFGSADDSIEIAEACGAEVLSMTWPNDFSVARNHSLDFAQDDAEWVFWIDADEHLQNPQVLRQYVVDGGLFAGYVVRQVHLCADQPGFDDKPVRLFRVSKDLQRWGATPRFFGVVHEQPEQAINEGIVPALDQQDFKIIHLGYEDEATRRDKMRNRNLPLLMKEITGKGTHPPRKLAWVLYLRDCVNLATWEMERQRGKRVPAATVLAHRAVGVYMQQGFDDPSTLLHELAWPYYQQALKILGSGVEVAWTFAAAPGRLDLAKVRPNVQTFKASSLDEIHRLTRHQVGRWTKELEHPVIDLEPFYTVDMPARTLSAAAVRDIIRKAAPHSWGDDKRVTEWAALFLEAIANLPQGAVVPPVLEIGTFKGASALMWLELLKALKIEAPVITIDPYGGKPYRGGNGDGEALYGNPEFTAMKRLLADYPNHYHFPITSADFFRALVPAGGSAVWHGGSQVPLDTFAFALLDGEHAAETIEYELDVLMGNRSFKGQPLVVPGGVIVVDNVDADPATLAMLQERFPQRELRAAKWNQLYAVVRVPAVVATAVQASALKEAA